MAHQLMKVINAPWALAETMLTEIVSIYCRHLRGEKIDLRMIEADLGMPLERDQEVIEMHGNVAVIPITGMLVQRANLFTKVSGGTSTQIAGNLMRAAIDDPAVRAIVLDIDSPGGEVNGTQELSDLVYAARQTKPVIAFSSSEILSGAYWIGSAASRVLISGNTVAVGSIGVLATHVETSEQERQQGIKITEIAAGKYKNVASSHEPLSDAGREAISERLDHLYTVFVNDVARNRGFEIENVLQNMADGRIFTGQQAIDVGLVDGVSTLSEIVDGLQRGDLVSASGDLAPQIAPSEQDEEIMMDYSDLNIDALVEHRADLVEAIQKAAVAEARAEGAQQERERIQAVHAQALDGFDDLIARLMFDGKTTGPEAAAQVVQAEKQKRADRVQAKASDAPAPVKPSNIEHVDDDPDFESLVVDAMTQKGITRAEAIRAVVSAHPEAHRRYIAAAQGRVRRNAA